MDRNLSIEEKLERLVPSSISEEGQQMLDSTIDELAGVDASRDEMVDPPRGRGLSISQRVFKIAAVVTALVVPVVMFQLGSHVDDPTEAALVVPQGLTAVASVSQEMVILKSTKSIDAQQNDGLIVPSDGAAPHYRYRYRVVDEEKLQDPTTGTVVTIRQPRQEVVTIPVTLF